MQQPCQNCGYISDRPARFCRQCGATLYSESEATTATTRNYSPNQAQPIDPNQPYTSPYASSGGWGDQVQDTTRFYRPPAAQNYENPAPKKSRALKWIVISLLTLLLLIGGSIALATKLFFSNNRNLASEVEQRIEEQIQARIREAEERAREAEDRALEAAKRASEAGGAVVAPPEPPPAPEAPGAKMSADLANLAYPKATVGKSSTIFGSEFVEMTTVDNFKTVRDFYQKSLGRPVVENNEAGDESAIFKSAGSSTIFVIVNHDGVDANKVKIVISRLSGLRIN